MIDFTIPEEAFDAALRASFAKACEVEGREFNEDEYQGHRSESDKKARQHAREKMARDLLLRIAELFEKGGMISGNTKRQLALEARIAARTVAYDGSLQPGVEVDIRDNDNLRGTWEEWEGCGGVIVSAGFNVGDFYVKYHNNTGTWLHSEDDLRLSVTRTTTNTQASKPGQVDAKPLNEMTRTAPERIWLQVSDDASERDIPFPTAMYPCPVSWCNEQIHEPDGAEVEYVRADLAALSSPRADVGKLAALGHLIATQDNRITAEPIFIVQQKRLYVGDGDYGESRLQWVDDEGREAEPAEADRLEREYDRHYEIPKGWRRLFVFDVWEFVTACFTEQGCKDYLARDGHNLREPRIYAAGSYRNEEWRAVRKFLLSIATAPDESGKEGVL